MLGYNKDKVLELFKNALPTRCYYLPFDIQNLRKAVESTKCVMTKEKLDKQLAGECSTLCMSHKTGSSEKHTSVKFDEYKLLDSPIDRLAKVIDKINTRLKGRQNK